MRVALLWLGLLASAVTADAAGRRVAIVIDTSGSMEQSDKERYTLQLSKIISDLLEPEDRLTVVRMPGGESCSAGHDTSLQQEMDFRDRLGFKRGLDQWRYSGGTYFAQSVRTAIRALGDPPQSRLLLILADSGGLGSCESGLTAELQALRSGGAAIAAINLGASGGAFDRNAAFTFTTGATSIEQVTRAVADVYQRFLGARNVQTGAVPHDASSIRVEIPAHVRNAFLVVAAGGLMPAIDSAPNNPSAEAIELNFRGGGATTGLDRVVREYRIVRLKRPGRGAWSFVPRGLAARAGWMLVLDYAVGLRVLPTSVLVAGTPGLIEIEAYDEDTGQRIAPASLPDLQVTVNDRAGQVKLNDTGTNGDRVARDGVYSGMIGARDQGAQPISATLRTGNIDRTIGLTANVVSFGVGLRLRSSPEFAAGALGALEIEPYDEKSGNRLDAAARQGLEITVDVDGRPTQLNDAGADGDRISGDGIYGGSIAFASPGARQLRARVVRAGASRDAAFAATVVDVDWVIRAATDAQVNAGSNAVIRVRVESARSSPRAGAVRPGTVDAVLDSAGTRLTLQDNGIDGDAAAGDGVYSATWQPLIVGRHAVEYRSVGGTPAAIAKADVDVLGGLEFGAIAPLMFGTLHGGAEARSEIDLSQSKVFGSFDVRISTAFARSGVALEGDFGSGWQRLDGQPLQLRLEERGQRRWPVRLRVGECPHGVLPSEGVDLILEAPTASGVSRRVVVPLALVVVPDSWLHCWWPVLAALSVMLLAAVMVHGYWSPWRFAPGAHVVISDVPQMNEGFAHPIRGQSGTGVRFYRDAAVYVCVDCRLRGKAVNAVARLTAGRNRIQIRPHRSVPVWRLTVDDQWEELPAEDRSARPDVTYRGGEPPVYFTVAAHSGRRSTHDSA